MANMIVMFEVEAADSGAVMQALAGVMPVLSNFSMENRVRPKRATRKITPRGSKVKEALRTKLGESGAATKEQLEDHLEAVGWNRKSASPALGQMRDDGEIFFDEELGAWVLKEGDQ